MSVCKQQNVRIWKILQKTNTKPKCRGQKPMIWIKLLRMRDFRRILPGYPVTIHDTIGIQQSQCMFDISILQFRTAKKQESLANAKVSARLQCVYEGPSEEIYGQCKEHDVEKYIQRVTTLSPTIRVYVYSFSSCCLSNLQNHVKFSENSNL